MPEGKKQVVKRINHLESEIKHEAKRVKKETPIKGSSSKHAKSNAQVPSGDGFRRVSAPVASSVQMTRTGPRVIGNKFSERGTTFMHRENFGQVVATNSYGVTQYSINPGLSNLFPWLAQETVGFESYVVESMSFEFVPFISSAADGTLVMCVDYDAADGAPSNRQQALNLAEAVSGQVWSSNVLHCGRKNTHKMVTERYLRAGALASNLDVKTYDVGKLYIITEGAEVGKLIGDLYVDYRIRLRTSQFNTGSMASVNAQSTFDCNFSGRITLSNAAPTQFAVMSSSGSVAPYVRTPFVVSGNVSALVSTSMSSLLGGFISGSVAYNTVPYAKSQAGRYTFGLDAAGRIYLPMGTWVMHQSYSLTSTGTAVANGASGFPSPTVSGVTQTVVMNISSDNTSFTGSVATRVDFLQATVVGAYVIPLVTTASWSTGGNVDYQYALTIKPYGGDTVAPLTFKLDDGVLWSTDLKSATDSAKPACSVRGSDVEHKESPLDLPNLESGSSSCANERRVFSVPVSSFVQPIDPRGLNSGSGQTGVIPAGPLYQPFLMRKS